MISEIRLKPEELVYLAVKCDGKTLDYSYVEMMPDVQVRGFAAMDEIMQSLIDKQLAEDNWGEFSVTSETAEFLSPVWNGTFESFFAVVEMGNEDKKPSIIRFHREGDKWILVQESDGELLIQKAAEESFEQVTDSLLPNGENKNQADVIEAPIDKYIVIKNMKDDEGTAVIEELAEAAGCLCKGTGDGKLAAIPLKDAKNIILHVLKGE